MTKKVYKQKSKMFFCHNSEFKLGNSNKDFSYF